ncbi:CRISPR-associated endonuclease Cas1 [Niveibacterium sp. 24ML]|uniref:CRISPR-associated endonuclease Cas1 n=1 Tax=Niveibacterium sp. 24ML TaxID=2985512 RepID=UPI00226EE129|nr:CRISPR-associated endonuclease Cas1 [Niveibacterium sp. 24ML]MCX9157923.1 CRISPR-associated endonuclease Cas1 [Niveibacterium sp. 24ML]
MIHPLYLDAANTWSIKLDQGIALHVSAPNRARTLFPLRRLSRVISPSTATWTTEALLACLRAGVTVVFHDKHGEPVAWCFGPRKRETTLGELLRSALAHTDGLTELMAWRHITEHNTLLATLIKAKIAQRTHTPESARAALCSLHQQRLGKPVGPLLRSLERSASGLLAQHLYNHVGDPYLIGFAREGFHLTEFLGSILRWHLHSALLNTPLATLRDSTPGRAAAYCLERESTPLYHAIGNALGDLERHLRERHT